MISIGVTIVLATIIAGIVHRIKNNHVSIQKVSEMQTKDIRTLFRENWSSGFLIRSNTNQAVQPQKIAGGLKFQFKK